MNRRTIVGTLAVFMFLLIATQIVTAASSAKDLLKEGNNYFNQGNYDKAIESYESLLNRFPKSKEANEAKKKLEDRTLMRYRDEKQKQAQASQKITEPLTEANFQYEQNQQGFITIKKYLNEKESGIRDLVIPSQIQGINVTEIEASAFAKGEYNQYYEFSPRNRGEIFESVTIPATVTRIGSLAFVGRGIKTLTLPESVRTIGAGAFAENQLSSVTLPANLSAINQLAFAKNQLTSIVIPSSVTQIGDGAFGSNRLTEFTVPEQITNIGEYAFAANMISKLAFSNSGKLTSIGNGAFAGNRLRSVVLPEGLTEITRGERSMTLGDYFENSFTGGILGGNPLGYIKIPSTLKGRGDGRYRPITDRTVPAVEWEQPITSMIDIEKADMFKIGANINTRDFDQGFRNFYISQGNKAGIYARRGPLWVTATQEEFDAFK